MERGSVIGLVVKRLYFGKRPANRDVGRNAQILDRLHARGYDWETLAKVVEGLALRRDRGELKGVGRQEPVSLLWVWDKDQVLNQVEVCLDAHYREAHREEAPRRVALEGPYGVTDIASIIKRGVA